MRTDSDFIVARIRSHAEERIRTIKQHLTRTDDIHPLAQARMSGALNEAETVLRMVNGEAPGREIDG